MYMYGYLTILYQLDELGSWKYWDNGHWVLSGSMVNGISTLNHNPNEGATELTRIYFRNIPVAECTTENMNIQAGQYVYVVNRDCTDYTVEKSHSYLPPSEVITTTMTSGYEWGTIEDDNWVAPKFYHLSSIRIYKDADTVSGIEVKYISSRTTGYEPLYHLYGRATHHSHFG